MPCDICGGRSSGRCDTCATEQRLTREYREHREAERAREEDDE